MDEITARKQSEVPDHAWRCALCRDWFPDWQDGYWVRDHGVLWYPCCNVCHLVDHELAENREKEERKRALDIDL